MHIRRLSVLDRFVGIGFLSAIVGALVVGAVGAASAGCTKDQKQMAKTAIDVTTASCIMLRGKISDDAFDTICATEEELAPLVKHIIGARRALAAKAGKPSASFTHANDLPPANGVDSCSYGVVAVQ